MGVPDKHGWAKQHSPERSNADIFSSSYSFRTGREDVELVPVHRHGNWEGVGKKYEISVSKWEAVRGIFRTIQRVEINRNTTRVP